MTQEEIKAQLDQIQEQLNDIERRIQKLEAIVKHEPKQQN